MSKDHAGARGRSYRLIEYWSTELSPVLKSNPESLITHTQHSGVDLRLQDRYTLHPVMGDGNLLISLPPQQCSNPCKILTCTQQNFFGFKQSNAHGAKMLLQVRLLRPCEG
jgi:hypothetical protein